VPPVNLGGVGRREPAESEPVGELTPRREGDWVSPDSGRETTTVTAAADSGFIDDAAQLRLPPNGGIVGAAICAAAAAAVAGASQRSDATDAPYPGAPLHDSFAFKSLLQKEGQRKERTDRDMVGLNVFNGSHYSSAALMLMNSYENRARLHRCWPTTGSEASRWSSRRARRP
jgi:hypothetical protein